MSEIGIRSLKQNASAVIAEAASGELITVTDRGRPVVQIVPLSSTRLEELVATERARPALRRLGDLPPPARGKGGRPRLSEAVESMREAERY